MAAEKNEREEQIADLYRDLLNREPDTSGLMNYFNSDLTIEQIANIIEDSIEYKDLKGLKGKKEFVDPTGSVGAEELFVMGSSPKTDENAGALKMAGIKAMLDLNVGEPGYDHSWCVDFLNVPLYTKAPLSEEQIDSCFAFIRRNVVEKSNKIFVHSDRGYSRAPLIMILFLIADKGLSFYEALRLVHSKQNSVNPERSLMTADVLEYVYKCRKKYGTVKREVRGPAVPAVSPLDSPPTSNPPTNQSKNIIRITTKLFAGSLIDVDIFEGLQKVGVKTIMDLNLNPDAKADKDLRFNSIHLPIFKDQLEVLMPMVMKSMSKYMEGGGLYIHCRDMDLVRYILDSYIKTNPKVLEELKKQQVNNSLTGL